MDKDTELESLKRKNVTRRKIQNPPKDFIVENRLRILKKQLPLEQQQDFEDIEEKKANAPPWSIGKITTQNKKLKAIESRGKSMVSLEKPSDLNPKTLAIENGPSISIIKKGSIGNKSQLPPIN